MSGKLVEWSICEVLDLLYISALVSHILYKAFGQNRHISSTPLFEGWDFFFEILKNYMHNKYNKFCLCFFFFFFFFISMGGYYIFRKGKLEG